MKIRSIHAVPIRSDLLGGPPTTAQRRPVWTEHAEAANPMSRYPRFKRLRSQVDLMVDCWHDARPRPWRVHAVRWFSM